MVAVAILGFFAFIFATIYLIYHFIKKINNKERVLSKKIFYTPLIVGLIFMVIGVFFAADTGTQAQLEKELAKNSELTSDIESLKSENGKLKKQVTQLESQITTIETQLETFQDDMATSTTEKESLNQQISELTATNTNLQDEVQDS